MPIEAKDIFEIIGKTAEEIDTPEKLKAHLDQSFAKVKSDTDGALINSSLVNMRRNLKDKFGIELTKEETEGKKQIEILDTVFTKIHEKLTGEIESLKQTATAPDERIKALETERDNFKTKYGEEKKRAEGMVSEHTTFKTQAELKEKNILRDFKRKDVDEKVIKWASSISPTTKVGFKTILDQTYNFDLDENQSLVPTDKKGNRIPHPKRANDFMTYEELILEEAIKHGVQELNPHGKNNNQLQRKQEIPNTNQQQPPNTLGRKVAEPIKSAQKLG